MNFTVRGDRRCGACSLAPLRPKARTRTRSPLVFSKLRPLRRLPREIIRILEQGIQVDVVAGFGGQRRCVNFVRVLYGFCLFVRIAGNDPYRRPARRRRCHVVVFCVASACGPSGLVSSTQTIRCTIPSTSSNCFPLAMDSSDPLPLRHDATRCHIWTAHQQSNMKPSIIRFLITLCQSYVRTSRRH